LYKKPEDADIDSLIDLALIIAIANEPYKHSFDTKSAKYVDTVIEYLDNEFGGIRTLLVDGPSEPGEEA